ncbi:uncharacterized protein LOC126743908 [Anthonomus grandis grandis]|uniref:uncharacterized protein LOC126743908 n=1 Tax=Anthonomus grandis grandis TaxID=2921223 RepID=UPI00216557BF|nr:uncharacterized protein LOC126743908 [Anthonomus grandis grandis]
MAFLFVSFVLLVLNSWCTAESTVKTQLKVLESKDRLEFVPFGKSAGGANVGSIVANEKDLIYTADNGYGNPGDLIYRYRESNDVLQIREVIVLPEISSDVQEVQWYAVTQARRITSVRVLNFGRERAYALRIDVAGNEVQAILRIPPNYDPRVIIEVYGV